MGTVYEGTVLTVDKDDSVARYLVEDGGRICYVGNELPTQYAGWRRVELGSKALCPSFVDTHQHMASFATFNAGLNVMDARSNAEIVERVGEFAAHSDDKTLIAFGASPYSVAQIQVDPLIEGNRIAVAAGLPVAGDCLCQVCAKKFPSPYEGLGRGVPWIAFPQLITNIRLSRRTRSPLDMTPILAGWKRLNNSQEPSQNLGKGNWDNPNLQKIGHLIFQTQ